MLENSSGLLCHSYPWPDAQILQVAASFAILLKPGPRIIVSRQVAIAVAKLILTSDVQKIQDLQGVPSFHFVDVRKTVLSRPRHPLNRTPIRGSLNVVSNVSMTSGTSSEGVLLIFFRGRDGGVFLAELLRLMRVSSLRGGIFDVMEESFSVRWLSI